METAKRPWSIVDFERIMLGSLVFGLFKTWLDWDALIARAAETSASPTRSVIIGVVFGCALVLGLTLLVSRRRSRVAMWVSVIFFALGVPMMLWMFAEGLTVGSPILMALQAFAQLVAYCLLFTPSARRWLNPQPEISAEIFR